MRAPRRKLGKGKTLVPTVEEAGKLLRSIATHTALELCDRARIGAMALTTLASHAGGYLSRIHGTRAAGRGRTAPLFQASKNRTSARSETPRNGEQLQRTNAWQMAPRRDCRFWSVASTIGTGEAATGGTKSGEQRVTGAATRRVRGASRQS